MKPLARLFKILAQVVQRLLGQRHAGFELDVGGKDALGKEAPARRREHLVDLDTSRGFFLGHSRSCFSVVGNDLVGQDGRRDPSLRSG